MNEPAPPAPPAERPPGWLDSPSGLALLTGLAGVLSGFAVYVTLLNEREHLRGFVTALIIAAALSFFLELLREKIQHHDHGPRRVRPRFSSVLFTLLIVVACEFFVIAGHKLPEFGPEEFEEAGRLLLRDHDGSWIDLFALAGVWVFSGACLALYLSRPGPEDAPLGARMLRRSLRGGAAGSLVAAGAILAYLIVLRVAYSSWMLCHDYDGLRRDVAAAGSELVQPLAFVYEKGALLFFGLADLCRNHGPGGFVLAGLLVAFLARACWRAQQVNLFHWVAGVVAVFLAVYLTAPLFRNATTSLLTVLLAAVIWTVPGLILGGVSPLLDRPDISPRHWSVVAFLGALLLTAVTLVRLGEWAWPVLAGVLFLIGLALARGGRLVANAWPLAITCVGITVAGAMDLLHATFSDVIGKVRAVRVTANTFRERPPRPDESRGLGELDRLARPSVFFDVEKLIGMFPNLGEPQKKFLRASLKLSDPESPGNEMMKWHQSIRAELREKRHGLGADAHEPGDARGGHHGKLYRAAKRIQRLEKLKEEAEGLRETAVRQLRVYEFVTRISPAPEGHYERVERSHRETVDDLKALTADLDEEIRRLKEESKPAEEEETKRSARLFELSIAGSYGFWVTMGLLAGWSARRRATRPAGGP